MDGCYIGLHQLVKSSKSMEELAVKIQNSSVNGDSEAVVICERVSLPDVPEMGSD